MEKELRKVFIHEKEDSWEIFPYEIPYNLHDKNDHLTNDKTLAILYKEKYISLREIKDECKKLGYYPMFSVKNKYRWETNISQYDGGYHIDYYDGHRIDYFTNSCPLEYVHQSFNYNFHKNTCKTIQDIVEKICLPNYMNIYQFIQIVKNTNISTIRYVGDIDYMEKIIKDIVKWHGLNFSSMPEFQKRFNDILKN